ncbi:MAG: NAD+ synthetase, partial [Bacteroidetes bacterium]|nr:NAD+ synthetase [Fibrella sp.]
MKLINVAAGVLNQTPLAWDANKQNIIDAIDAAHSLGVSLLCLPELCISGYGCEDAFYAQNTIDQSMASLLEIVEHTNDITVSVGLPVRHNNRTINTACLISNKRILGFIGKQHLPQNGIHYEPRWFQPWPAGLRE